MDSSRALLADAARRGADYLEGLDRNPVFPRDADVDRLRTALDGDLPLDSCGGTRWHGRQALRISVSSWATTQDDMMTTRNAILAAAGDRQA